MMNRRHLLKSFVAATVAASLPYSAKGTTHSGSNAIQWKNWSGNLSAQPKTRKSIAALSDLNPELFSKGNVRVVGTGHSFSPLVPTNDTMLSVRRLSGIRAIHEETQRAEIGAGTLLGEAGRSLDQSNQAMINMPDIDQQTLGGAISTATHGTGLTLGCLSDYVTDLEIYTADGVLRRCNKNVEAELFEAARVGLGAMGIITSVTMQNRRPFNLVRNARWLSFEEAIEEAMATAKNNRNYEFYTIPFTGMVLSDTLNETSQPADPKAEIDGNDGLMQLKDARDYLSWSPTLRKLILSSYMKTIDAEQNIDKSFAIYATERNVRFNEMEYHLPIDKGLSVLIEIKELIEKKFPEVFFPIECRFVKGDDCWLSPFYGRDSISIAVHRYFNEDYTPLFKAIEPIFLKNEGRPHWGKMNYLTAAQHRQNYDKWDDFVRVRKAYDPEGVFLNGYLGDLFNA